MSITATIAIFIGICGVLFGVICLMSRRIQSLKSTNAIQGDEIKKAEESIKEVEDVQNEIAQVDEGNLPPEEVPPPGGGDSNSRLGRLNRL